MRISLGPTGNIIRGHVLDCSKVPLERKLRELDSNLYVKWNPRKLKGFGTWEIRRRPELKTAKDFAIYKGDCYTLVDYVENDMENHILDVPFLNYGVITKLESMDTWSVSRNTDVFAAAMESRAASAQQKIDENAKSERRYELKQQRSMIRDLMDYTLSGGDPSEIARYWPK
jgi:hypothetical protein